MAQHWTLRNLNIQCLDSLRIEWRLKHRQGDNTLNLALTLNYKIISFWHLLSRVMVLHFVLVSFLSVESFKFSNRDNQFYDLWALKSNSHFLFILHLWDILFGIQTCQSLKSYSAKEITFILPFEHSIFNKK